MRNLAPAPFVAAILLVGCSEQTQDNAQDLAAKAAADTEANLEVVENAVREEAIDAADRVSTELKHDEEVDPDQGDGKLDGTD